MHKQRISRHLKRECKKTGALFVMMLLLLGVCVVLCTTDLPYWLWHREDATAEPSPTPKPIPVYIITGNDDNRVVEKIELQNDGSE